MQRGDIVFVRLPRVAGQSGHEQIGRRPALVIHNNETANQLSVIMVVPMTSNLNAERFSHTILVEPSATNGLNTTSVLLVFQLRAIDKKRIERKIGTLESSVMENVNKELKKLLQV